MLGTMCKVDPITETQARGRYARICVEIDISKPLLGSLTIDDRTVRVEYESLGLICFKCGRYGHSKDSCREGVVEQKVEDPSESDGITQDEKEKNLFGPWMLVSYGKHGNRNSGNRVGRGAVGRKNYGNGKTAGSSADTNFGKTAMVMNTDAAKKVNVNKASGSRFDILSEEGDVMMKKNEGQLNMSSDEIVGNGSKTKDVGILSEITNLSEEHRN
ncbi:hypothetical protein Dsin_032138 [Dipteronia sinensis]|uniref:CCHC-type domain-containing protein n=1 Tax=Dipteronia sinensis TaxID=43782 RepID=A0AAD9ZN03_9ROSI|nr:hypothetical protein Dsin_032138 [Dipteronia sinensis]